MRSIFFLITSVLFIHNISFGQITDVLFIGSVSVDGGKSYTYKLYADDSEDIVTGYSVMDLMGPDETKTYISGKINREKRQLVFRETRIWYTKSKENDTDFCYLHARLKAGKIQGANTLKGSFTGYKANGKTECAKGKIMLVCAQDALDKLMEIAEKEKIAPPDSVKKKPKVVVTYEKELDESSVLRVLPGESVDIPCATSAVTVDVWDAKTIDGDNITLMQDNTTILDKYTISGTHKSVDIAMGGNKKVVLKLIANNEGTEPMNTARVKITSGTNEQYIDATTTMGKDVLIVLNRK